LFVLAAASVGGQTSARLPLPADGPASALPFEVPAPTAGVLTGLLLPAAGPLTSWAPVFAVLQADGSLKESESSPWTGPRPERWLKVVKSGFTVGGLRLLVKTGPGAFEVRQLQVFWRPWDGPGATLESAVFGLRAGPADQVKIVELTVPAGAAATGLWGQTSGGRVAQASLLVRLAPSPAAAAPAASSGPGLPDTVQVPGGPTVAGPQAPGVPALKH